MPNHIKNRLRILSGDANEVFDHMKTEDSEFDFNKIVPQPEYLFQGNLSLQVENIVGKRFDWYSWNIENWGTKWNAYNIERTADNEIMFDTAWNGVPRLMVLLMSMFDVADYEYEYSDEDFGYNCGRITSKKSFVNADEIEDNSAESFLLAASLRPDFVSNSEDEEGYYFDENHGILYREGK